MRHQETRDNYERFVAAYQAGEGPQPKLMARHMAYPEHWVACDPTEWSDDYDYFIMLDDNL